MISVPGLFGPVSGLHRIRLWTSVVLVLGLFGPVSGLHSIRL